MKTPTRCKDTPDLFGVSRNPNCQLCKLHKTATTVCMGGKGPSKCNVMIVTDTPSRKEDETGRHFQGLVKELLQDELDKNGLKDVYFAFAVSCRPPEEKSPSKGEIKACKAWLDAQIQAVKPKFILLLGNVPLQSVTGSGGIKKQRGRPFEQEGIIYVPAYHPAFILRDPTQRDTFNRDIKLFADIVSSGGMPREKELNAITVTTHSHVATMLEDLTGEVSFDIETNCLYPWQTYNEKGILDPATVKRVGFGTRNAEYSIIMDAFSKDERQSIIDQITERLEECELVVHNGKFDFLWMWVHFGVRWHEFSYFDTMLAHYLLDENDRHGLKYLAQKYLGAPDWDVDQDTKTGKGDATKLTTYHAHDLYYTRKLRTKFGKMLREDAAVARVFYKLMMPVSRLFVEVEYDGIYVDETKYDAASEYLHTEYEKAKKELATYSSINWASVDELRKLLFTSKKEGGLGLKPLDKTKASSKHPQGRASTSESVLKRLDHPCVGALLKFREVKQQLSFFIEGWKPFFHRTPSGVYLHPSFKLHGAVTGRPSCEHPNLQQVPRDERIRSLITAPPGWTLIDADLSQIELRIAAFLAREKELMRVFIEGGDPHWLTCIRELGRGMAEPELVVNTAWTFLKRSNAKAPKPRYAAALDIVYEMGPDEAVGIDKRWKEFRKKAKAVNFGFLYGMWWKKFKMYARDNYGVVVTDEQAEAAREAFFELYSDFPKWHTKQKMFARRNGYVRTLSGRKRRLPNAMLPDDSPLRGAAERQAVNSPVQGFAAELNLMVALQMRKEFTRAQVRIVGTVHDSILMWVKNGLEERVTKRVQEITRRPDLFDVFNIKVDIPIEGDAALGAWGAGKSLKKWLEANNVQSKSVKDKNVAKVPRSVLPKIRREAA